MTTSSSSSSLVRSTTAAVCGNCNGPAGPMTALSEASSRVGERDGERVRSITGGMFCTTSCKYSAAQTRRTERGRCSQANSTFIRRCGREKFALSVGLRVCLCDPRYSDAALTCKRPLSDVENFCSQICSQLAFLPLRDDLPHFFPRLTDHGDDLKDLCSAAPNSNSPTIVSGRAPSKRERLLLASNPFV